MGEVITEHGLTAEEQIVMDKIIEAYEAFCKLERQHPDEDRDFTSAVHKIQSILALRIVRRVYPVGWPIKKAGD